MRSLLTISTCLLILFGNAQIQKIDNMPQEKITVEVWSDVVCPFCYLGKKKLENAIKELEAEQLVEVIWKSFQLDPNFPKDTALPSAEYLSQRKGYPIDQVRAMSHHLANQGLEYGIDFQFEKALTFNTFDAHRLIHWANEFHKSNELKQAFLIAYFTNGENLSQAENLIKVVCSIGLDSEKAKAVLDSDKYAEEVRQDIYQAQQVGVRGVPFFLINNNQTISGAQDDKVFVKALKAEMKKTKPLISSEYGAACAPDGKCD